MPLRRTLDPAQGSQTRYLVISRIFRSVRLRLLGLCSRILGAMVKARLENSVCSLAQLDNEHDCLFWNRLEPDSAVRFRTPVFAATELEQELAQWLRRPKIGPALLAVLPDVTLDGLHRDRDRPLGRLKDGRLLEECSHMKGFTQHELRWQFSSRRPVGCSQATSTPPTLAEPTTCLHLRPSVSQRQLLSLDDPDPAPTAVFT